MTDDRLREAISDAEDNLRRTREFAQVLVDTVERLKLGKRGPGSGSLRLAYEVLDCADATIKDWSKMFDLATQRRKTE